MTLMITVTDEAALKAEATAAAAGGDLSAEEWADLRLGVACDLEMVVNPLCGPGYWISTMSNAASGSAELANDSRSRRLCCNQLQMASSRLD